MTLAVSDAVIWAGVRDALRSGDVDLGTPAQWAGVADYAATRGADPASTRGAVLAELLGCSPDPQMAFAAAADRLTDPSQVPTPGLRALLREWLAEDVATAAPLLGVFTGHGTDVEHPDAAVSVEDCERVAAWLSTERGRAVEVVGGTVIGGGFSRRMWRMRILDQGRDERVIVRAEQGGMFGTDTVGEVRVMRALHDAGFPVPRVLLVDADGSALGTPAFVMEEAPGVVRLDDTGIDDVIRATAELHRVPVTALEAEPRTAEQVVADNLAGWLEMYRAHAPYRIPLLEEAGAWLGESLRPTGDPVIVHGDPGPGNALFDPVRGLTVLDWEFGHVGDAAEDWAYLAFIRGRRIMDATAWQRRLASVAGVEFSADQWSAWLAFNHLRGACVNLTARSIFERGPRRVADHLAIGTAVHLRFLASLVDMVDAVDAID